METIFKIKYLYASLPFGSLIIGGLMILVAQLIIPRAKTFISFIIAIISIICSIFFILESTNMLRSTSLQQELFQNHLIWSSFSALYALCIVGCLLIIVLAMPKLLSNLNVNFSEAYQLILYIGAGLILLVSSNNLMTMFVSLELSSLPLFVFAGWYRTSKASNEAGIKYFILSVLAIAFLLLGIAFIFGATGSMYLTQIKEIKLNLQGLNAYLYLLGFIFLFIGIGFKVAFFPLHAWVVDVYEGTITIFTTLMASIIKIGSIGFLFKLMYYLYSLKILIYFNDAILYLSVASMLYGNFAALKQTNLKRIFAFSSIAHTGSMLSLFYYVNNQFALQNMHASLFYYLTTYIIATLLVFLVIAYLESTKEGSKIIALNDIKSLSKKNPILAFCLSIACLSLAGIPPLFGFYGKLYILQSLLTYKIYLLSIFIAINSFIAIFYYMRIVLYIYWRENANPTTFKLKGIYPYLITVTLTAILIFTGVFYESLYRLANYVFQTL